MSSQTITQRAAVTQAMQANGGYATLGLLYQTAIKVPGSVWETKTPFHSIRRIVQEGPEFFKIRPGLWALTAQKEAVLQKFMLGTKPAIKQQEEFTHSYYQGLLLEIGNAKGFQTWVPAQDKNRLFLEKRLAEIATLTQFPRFTYDALLPRVQTIDVVWFNSRGFPDACFEVEHSTDIHNSLLKYVELQDFRTRFNIVADAARRKDYDSKIAYTGFTDIRDAVRFVDYDNLSALHSKVNEAQAMSQLVGF